MDAEVDATRQAASADIELPLLLDALYLKYHYDFRGYALASLRRRLRSAMTRFGCRKMCIRDRRSPSSESGTHSR